MDFIVSASMIAFIGFGYFLLVFMCYMNRFIGVFLECFYAYSMDVHERYLIVGL